MKRSDKMITKTIAEAVNVGMNTRTTDICCNDSKPSIVKDAAAPFSSEDICAAWIERKGRQAKATGRVETRDSILLLTAR